MPILPYSFRQAPQRRPGQRESARTPAASISRSREAGAREKLSRGCLAAGTTPRPERSSASDGKPRSSRYARAAAARGLRSSRRAASKKVSSSSARRSRGACALDRSRIDSGALGEVPDGADELLAAGNGAVADVGGPEHRLAAMDEEAARRWPVRDDALGADAEPGVRVLLVRGDPAAGVAAPAELRERLVEPVGERGQDDLGVEVRHPDAARRAHQNPYSARKASIAIVAISL